MLLLFRIHETAAGICLSLFVYEIVLLIRGDMDTWNLFWALFMMTLAAIGLVHTTVVIVGGFVIYVAAVQDYAEWKQSAEDPEEEAPKPGGP